MALRLILNGEDRVLEALEPGQPLAAFVQTLQFRPDRVAVELNGDIAPRTEWGTIALADGDKLEVVHFVGGGLQA